MSAAKRSPTENAGSSRSAKRKARKKPSPADARQRLFDGQRRMLGAQRRLFSRAHDAFATLQNEQQAFVDRWLDDRRLPDEARELVDTWRVVSDQNRRQLKTAVDASFEALEDLLTRLGDPEHDESAASDESDETPSASEASSGPSRKTKKKAPKKAASKKTPKKKASKKPAKKKATKKKAAKKATKKKAASRKKKT